MAYPRMANRSQRNRWYDLVDKGKSVKEVCVIFGISRQCYYRWRHYDFYDIRSYRSAKKQPNTKLTPQVRQFIEQAKWKTNYGPLKMKLLIKQQLGLDISTTIIYRYFKRQRLIRRPQRRCPWYEPLKHALTIVKPGQGVQMDVKYIYESGLRKYQFSIFDPYTRKYYFKVFNNKYSVNAIATLIEGQKYFGFKVVSIQTDNGSEFRGELHGFLAQQQINHYFIPKHSPYWNGHVERVHRTIDDEYYHNPYRVWKTPYEWLGYYNFERIHLSLNGLTPQQAYLKSVTLDC
jgi:transposase